MGLRLLNGLKVLEVGDTVAVAFAGKLLADLGADVVMVEPPGGSPLRRLPPYYQDIPGPERSVLHNWLSANKRSITLDVKEEQGRAIFRELLRGVHVLVRGPAMSMDAADLKAGNPSLTVTTITPFGPDGPYASYQANDLILFAMSGFSYYLACPVDDPSSTPPKQNPGYQVGLVAGLSAAISTLWGVAASQKKGRGVSVDVSEWEAFTHLLYEHTAQLSDGKLPSDRKRRPGAVITVVGGLILCLPCSDGWVLASPREDHQFKLWGELIEDPAWASQPQFANSVLREQHGWEIYERSAAWTRLRKKADVCLAAQEKKIACFPVSQMTDLPEMEQLRHRRFWAALDHPVIKGLEYPGLPARLDSIPGLPSRGAPEPGEHSLEVCEELGLPPEQIRHLREHGIV
jgi:crotonobetainyl-CoA:carnitine CoA-transferase CaiB-like acyl-CoA transferase